MYQLLKKDIFLLVTLFEVLLLKRRQICGESKIDVIVRELMHLLALIVEGLWSVKKVYLREASTDTQSCGRAIKTWPKRGPIQLAGLSSLPCPCSPIRQRIEL